MDAATLQVQRRTAKPFGEDRGTAPAAWPGERGFVGGTQDKTTGLTHLGAREYDPLIGRFISVDPLMVVDDPRQHNGYQYGNNSPLTEWDPTGEALPECQSGMYKCTNGSNPYDYGHNYEKEVAIAGGTLDRAYVDRKNSYNRACRYDSACKTTRSYYTPKKVEKKPAKKTLWDSLKSGANATWSWTKDTFGTWEGWKNRVLPTLAFGACLVATVGGCMVAGAAVAFATFGGDYMVTGEANWSGLGKSLLWTAAGGAVAGGIGRATTGSWQAAFGNKALQYETVPLSRTVGAPYKTKVPGLKGPGGGRKVWVSDTSGTYAKVLDRSATLLNAGMNAHLSLGFCGAGSASIASGRGC
ncbi:RHS repeat-associated core domain-containing protein [Streptomyces sp. PCS3-D2]|nr:RHS repeat-associated core domain-containing protein [Streptomyces sp. PCS3-D2]WKV76280.1 RHS repeat-associated core domain-containing protein [Streptomyces sp. PCS3-D2]